MNDAKNTRYRSLGKDAKFKTRTEDDRLYISGYFSVFDSVYELWPGATESIDDCGEKLRSIQTIRMQ